MVNAESTAINLSEGVGDLGAEWDLLISETNAFPSKSTSDSEDLSSDKVDFDNDNSSTEQLTEMLLAPFQNDSDLFICRKFATGGLLHLTYLHIICLFCHLLNFLEQKP